MGEQLAVGRNRIHGAAQVRWPAWAPSIAATATAGIFVAMLLYRNHRLLIAPELWAEDLVNYLIDDRLFGAAALLIPHNGFVQLCCRLVAWMAGMADPAFAPRIYATAFLASIALTATLVYTSPLFERRSKPLAALALVAVPVSSEVFYGMCYMQWVMGPLVAIALCERAPAAGRAALLIACVALLGASAPFALIAAPFVAFKIFRERSRFAMLLAAAVVVSAPVQVAPLMQRFAANAASGPVDVKLDAIASISYRWLIGGAPVSVLGCIVIAIGTVAAAAWYLSANRRLIDDRVFYVAGFAVALLFVSCWSLGADRINQYGQGGRYFYIPLVLALWVVVLIEQRRAPLARPAPGIAVACAALLFAHADRAAYHFVATDWQASAACLHTQASCSAQANPNWLGRWSVPSDAQVKALTGDAAASFQRRPAG